jgi:hypothetical protein
MMLQQQQRSLLIMLLLLATTTWCINLSDPHRKLTLVLVKMVDGTLTTKIGIGNPERSVVFMLDFQSDVSGVWQEDLLRTSETFCDECAPVTRDYMRLGAHRYFFALRSAINEQQLSAALGEDQYPLPYAPSPRLGVGGWLALSPRSEIWRVWNSIELTIDSITFSYHPQVGNRTVPADFLTKRDRTFPNIPLRLHPHSKWWHQGWLASVSHTADEDVVMDKSKRLKDKEWLQKNYAEKSVFILFGNETKTRISQRVFNSLFYRSNVFNHSTMPDKICLAPGLYLQQKSWLKSRPLVGATWLSIGYLPRYEALRILSQHPIDGVEADDINMLSMNNILTHYRIKMHTSGELAFIQNANNAHIAFGKLVLSLVIIVLILVVYLSRSIYIRPQVFQKGFAIRPADAKRARTLGFRKGGYVVFLLAQALSIACALTAYWTSSKLTQMRTSSKTDVVIIYWIMTIGLHLWEAASCVNLAVFTLSWLDKHLALERLRARVFVITQVTQIQGMMTGLWYLLIDRSASDSANIASSLLSVFMFGMSVLITLILFDWLTFTEEQPHTQLWPGRHFRLASLHLGTHLSEPLSFYYALIVVALSTCWTVWIGYFSIVLQLYEMLTITMATVSNTTLILLSTSVVLFTGRYAFMAAGFLTQLNHLHVEDD